MSELKNCPFCNAPAWVEPTDPKTEGDSWTQISCGNDQCKVGVVVASHDERSHRAEAITAWNTRHQVRAEVVGEIVAWLRDQWKGRLQSSVFLADEIEAKFGGRGGS